MSAPRIDQTKLDEQVDTDGKKWFNALALPDGTILAGRDQMGNFRSFVDQETLYDYAMKTLQYLAEMQT